MQNDHKKQHTDTLSTLSYSTYKKQRDENQINRTLINSFSNKDQGLDNILVGSDQEEQQEYLLKDQINKIDQESIIIRLSESVFDFINTEKIEVEIKQGYQTPQKKSKHQQDNFNSEQKQIQQYYNCAESHKQIEINCYKKIHEYIFKQNDFDEKNIMKMQIFKISTFNIEKFQQFLQIKKMFLTSKKQKLIKRPSRTDFNYLGIQFIPNIKDYSEQRLVDTIYQHILKLQTKYLNLNKSYKWDQILFFNNKDENDLQFFQNIRNSIKKELYQNYESKNMKNQQIFMHFIWINPKNLNHQLNQTVQKYIYIKSKSLFRQKLLQQNETDLLENKNKRHSSFLKAPPLHHQGEQNQFNQSTYQQRKQSGFYFPQIRNSLRDNSILQSNDIQFAINNYKNQKTVLMKEVQEQKRKIIQANKLVNQYESLIQIYDKFIKENELNLKGNRSK